MFIFLAVHVETVSLEIAMSGVEFQTFQCQKHVCQVLITSSIHDGDDLNCWFNIRVMTIGMFGE